MTHKHDSDTNKQVSLLDALQAIQVRLVRIETRQARQMVDAGLSPQGPTQTDKVSERVNKGEKA
jgi:hypothetical protein